MNAVGMTAGAAAARSVTGCGRTDPAPAPPPDMGGHGLPGSARLGGRVLPTVVLRHWAASRASYGFVIIPFVTVVLSAWLDNEPVGVGLVLGGLLVLAGVYVGALRPAVLTQRLGMRN